MGSGIPWDSEATLQSLQVQAKVGSVQAALLPTLDPAPPPGSLDSIPEIKVKTQLSWGFPGGAVVRNPPANAGDTGSCPGLGRSHMPRSG